MRVQYDKWLADRGGLVIMVLNSWLECRGFEMVPLKKHHVEGAASRYICRGSNSTIPWCGVVVWREIPAQVSSSSFDQDSKLRACGYGHELVDDVSRFQAVVAEWSRYRIVAVLDTSSSPVPPKTGRVGKRCTLNLSRAQTSSLCCGVGVRRGECRPHGS
ncbi:hypothetical protein TNCV_4383721 [Trichonephila clavipes]|nr:hypothetical protein TNCV_4383721 [Trichonephila clavipes]